MKNDKPCIIIRCIALDIVTIEKNILDMLEPFITNALPRAQIRFEESEIYWKFPECKDIIYGFYHQQRILIKDLIKIFFVTWNYAALNDHLIDEETEDLDERAIWNKNCHPEEIFIHPAVEWVNIYTWPDTAPAISSAIEEE